MSDPSLSGQRGVITWAARYDWLLTVVTLGRERALRERMLELAKVAAGDSILDVGCGTGTLAIAAKRRVGDAAPVHGIDASPEMIARAQWKANRERVSVTFEVALADALPFPDGRFDVVLSTVMLHHLRRAAREQCVREIRRVLKPGGRVLVVDFGRRTSDHGGLMAHFHRHGRVSLSDLESLQRDAGIDVVDSGSVGTGTLLFVLGEVRES